MAELRALLQVTSACCDDIRAIRYFTAHITGPTLPNQLVFLKALATLPAVEVVLGRFKMKRVRCEFAPCTHPGINHFEKPEEKRTDVNIAVSMVDDAYQNLCDHLILVSGDSDLVPAVRLIRNRFPAKKITGSVSR